MAKKQDKKKLATSTLGGRLKAFRVEQKLDTSVFAHQIGLSSQIPIVMIEGGDSLPDVKTLMNLADKFEIDLHELITGEPSPALTLELEGMRKVKHQYRLLASGIQTQMDSLVQLQKKVKGIIKNIDDTIKPRRLKDDKTVQEGQNQ